MTASNIALEIVDVDVDDDDDDDDEASVDGGDDDDDEWNIDAGGGVLRSRCSPSASVSSSDFCARQQCRLSSSIEGRFELH
jgi:hypothetical protein